MSEKIVKLSFSGPVHFGNGRLEDGVYTCDAATLFSALYIEAISMGCAEALLNAVQTGQLYFSDAHPFIGDVLYVPKPMLQFGSFDQVTNENEDPRERKAAKKIACIPIKSLSKFKAGTMDYAHELERFTLGVPSLQTKVNLVREATNDAKPYHVGGFSFAPNAGLYFIVRGTFDLIPLLDQLQYSGLGGKRSSGYGRFEYKLEQTDALTVSCGDFEPNSAHMLLSSAAPQPQELTDDLMKDASYRLVRKGGFVQSSSHSATPQKKKDFYVFAAGSVFSQSFDGDVFDVNATPGAHAVHRYARAMWMEV